MRRAMALSLFCCASLLVALSTVVLQIGVAEAASPTWSIYPSPNQGTYSNDLVSVSCTSSTDCVAVGYYQDSNLATAATLVETWNGTSWSVTSSPSPGSTSNFLYGVSCTSSTYCVAVGEYANQSGESGVSQSLIETWNGTAWSVTPSPNEGSSDNFLNSVSCTSSTNCVAVGYYANPSVQAGQTLIETWNGTAWSVTSSPNEGSGDNHLNGVSCTSSTNCVAVGDYINASHLYQTLAETWNGTIWSVTPSPSPGSYSNTLANVSCTSATSCLADGGSISSGVGQTLVETWNGTIWSVIASPNPGPGAGAGVSCTSSTNCVVVGDYYIDASDQYEALAATWNGTDWSVTPMASFNGNGVANYLDGVSCTSTADCVAVGTYSAEISPVDLFQTLVETTGTAPPVVTTEPVSQSVNGGGDVTFTAAASGNPSPTVQWQESTDAGTTWANINGATSTIYSETNVPYSQNGWQLRAIFTNTNGSATTNAATLTVLALPPTTSVLIPSNGATLSGSLFLDAAASDNVPITQVNYVLSGGTYNDTVISGSFPTYFGWIGGWNTTTVPNGTYTLQSVATNAADQSTPSASISVTVNNPPPTTTVALPADGATVTGSQWLDASASPGVTKVQYELTGGSYSDTVISGSTPTYYGWIGAWNTTTVPNGTYTLQSVASYAGGVAGTSAPITITVNNPPPTTTVLVPSNGATQSGGAAILDASASASVTSVSFELTGGTLSDQVISSSTPTYFGWIGQWDTTTVPDGTYTLQSVASYAGGVAGTSQGITITVNN